MESANTGKNRFVLFTTDDKLTELIAKLREKGYNKMEINPSDINKVDVAIITKMGVADEHPNKTEIDAIPKNTALIDDQQGVAVKTSGKEMPSSEASKEAVSGAAITPAEAKEAAHAASNAEKDISKKDGVNMVRVDESDDEKEQRYTTMVKNKGFKF
jgi:hypothetical protein